ncbi:2OG-Fe(II) oxygenase [Nonomuraea jiangxiensis]|uniref:Proline 4-hydroxylase (Includes Rps23 Pro-64 3,4-dihydroxylase Tpa1), contains SM-20 domain n=1 Tax=Nonomuraea jiangxiensis TaxID=633440 RepID=A0A1G8MEX7_9ACTN|nr:2OG-Fe(II) oxygenase [Nonomuraea jiangxiensis]SDI66484.1 Proline 4-hydroxylase (includes Rps23 Pro-64 3,4-dihydroxylase Tpa1), contains SM-20 domain [Nonomuraea jiangxiensis]
MQKVDNFTFRREDLLPLGDKLRDSFLNASPFRHVVIDDFLPPNVLEPVLAEFPEPRDVEWQRFDNAQEIKLALADTERMGPATRHLLAEFNGQVFIDFLERLSGIEHLVSDPHYDGGGLHQIKPGGFLKVHVDFNRHRRLNLDRRLNGLLYLNKEWEESYGGHLQLWNKDMTECEHKILPVFNRFVLFATTDDANHGHPEPLTCPDDRARRSMALYYYTNGRPEDEVLDEHDTKFKQRPGEEWKSSLRQTARRWVPPVLADLATRRK